MLGSASLATSYHFARAKSPPRELGPSDAIRLPPTFEDYNAAEGSHWTILKVDNRLDWRTALHQAKIRLAPNQQPELQTKSDCEISARVLRSRWSQYIPLRPTGSDGNTLVASQTKIRGIIEIVQASKETMEVEAHVREVEEAAAVAEKRRQAGAARQRQLMLEQRQKALDRFNVASLSDALGSVGFPVETMDEGKTKKESEEETVVHLRVLSDEELGTGRLPVAFWGATPMKKGWLSQINFNAFKHPSWPTRLAGKVRNAAHQDFIGTMRTTSPDTGFTYLLGIQAKDSKRLFIHEAEMYHIALRHEPSAKTANESGKPGYELKNLLIQDWGTLKKQRQNKQQQARASRQVQIADLGGYNQEMQDRAKDLKARVASVETQDAELKSKLLPPFDPQATDPRQVYREGLQTIAPDVLLDKEPSLSPKQLVDFFQKDCRMQAKIVGSRLGQMDHGTRDEFTDLSWCNSRLVLLVLSARAQGDMVAKSTEEATKVASQIAALEALMTLLLRGSKHRGGKCLPGAVAELVGLDPDSPLVAHWHKELYEDITGKRKVRAFNGRKVLCMAIIWALHLTPRLALDLPETVALDLGLPPQQLKKGLEFVGCTVNEDRLPEGQGAGAVFKAKLEGPPKLNRGHWEGGKGGGKGKKRGRE